jgi:hypothetical protein
MDFGGVVFDMIPVVMTIVTAIVLVACVSFHGMPLVSEYHVLDTTASIS